MSRRLTIACVPFNLLLVLPSILMSADVRIGVHAFSLPDEFTVELIAEPPLVERPIAGAFDERGRLYVSESSGTNDNVQEQLKMQPHRLLRLTDTDGDGRFDQKVVFAEQLMFPEGTMWLNGSLYVSAPPVIWKFTDRDDDGVADERVVFFDGKTLTGCANDLHGPYAGRDGWIYWCKGAFAPQTYERPGKKNLETKAAHIFRCRPDGSGIEPVMTGGMDNPVDVVFTPTGERLFTTTFLVHPGGGLRDGMIHAIYGGVYGKVHNVLDGHPRTGDVMPVLVHMGPAAPCGLTLLESKSLGNEYHHSVLACSFNMHKVTRHILTPRGATFSTRDEDFLISDNLDFHPTDVLEDADGSVIVVNTGGWYKLCCPTSQLWKPDILGGIYRIRRIGMPRPADARGVNIRWSESNPAQLTGYLDDLRPVVRQRAIQELTARGSAAIDALRVVIRNPTEAYVDKRRNAVWTLTRMDHSAARTVIREALADLEPSVKHAALSSISLWRDTKAVPELLRVLHSDEAMHQRVAAEALGRIGDPESVAALLAAASDSQWYGDRVREHSLIYALIEIGDVKRTRIGLASNSPGTQRAALIAVDQMESGALRAEEVGPLLSSSVPMLKETATWLVGRHAEWGGALAETMRIRLADLVNEPRELQELSAQLALFAGQSEIQELLSEVVRQGAPLAQTVALQAMRDSGLKELPAAWVEAIIAICGSGAAESGQLAAWTVRNVAVPKIDAARVAAALIDLSLRPDLPTDIRLDALSAIAGGLSAIDDELLLFLFRALGADESVPIRSAAADILSRSKLGSAQLVQLAERLVQAGPLEVDRLLAAFDQSQDETVGMALVVSLENSPALASLRADALRTRLAKFGPKVEAAGARLYAALNVDPEKQRAKMEQLLAGIKDGDVRRGQSVFHHSKTACAACHQMGYLGGNIGPDLTRIGDVRNERDLLESIVFPSSSFVRSYEPIVVLTKDGQAVAGLMRKEFPDAILVATGARTEVRIARDNIEELRPGNVSIMPSGLDQQLSVQDLADLIAFLKAKK